MTTTPDDDEPKRISKATLIRRGLVVTLAVACAGGLIYTRWIVKKESLGGPCTYDIHCRAEAPRCMKQDVDGAGVCTRPCDNDGDCAADIMCIKVQLDDYDEHGKPLEGGYCYPQALLDARRKKKNDGGAAAATGGDGGIIPGSWVKVPQIPDQFEGEVTLDHGTEKRTFEIKGSVFRVMGTKKRTVFDTSALREYSVDDDKKEYSATSLATSINTVKVTKTDKKDTVADHECQIWTIEEGKSVREVCAISGGSLVGVSGRGVASWERELASRSVIPVRLVDEGKTKFIASKIDLHPIDDKEFLVPKAYHNKADIHLP